MPVTTRVSARELLLVAAERMIAERGPAVSLREIAAEAGQRNNAAVHYHFGSRDGLIQAIVERRQETLERERLAVLAAQEVEGRTDLAALVEALVAPLFTAPYADGATHYARFLEKVRDWPSLVALAEHDWPATTMILSRISRALSEVPKPARDLRLRAMMTVMFALLADLERVAHTSLAQRALAQQTVLDVIVGMLSAPHTPTP